MQKDNFETIKAAAFAIKVACNNDDRLKDYENIADEILEMVYADCPSLKEN